MINCKLHRLLVNNNVFGSARSDVCYHGKTRATKSYKIHYKVKTDKNNSRLSILPNRTMAKGTFISCLVSRQSKSVCFWQEPAWNVNYINQPTKSLNSRLEGLSSPRNFKKGNKEAKIYMRRLRTLHGVKFCF